MKRILLLLVVLIVSSCSEDEQMTLDGYTLETADARAIIATVENSMSIEYPNEILKFGMSEIKKIDESYYMVVKSGDYISTTLLKNVGNDKLISVGISCTSKQCSSSPTGCIPRQDRKSCSKCNHGAGDCVKTVIGGDNQE